MLGQALTIHTQINSIGQAAIFTFLALSITVATYRIYLRIMAVGRLVVDDYFMIVAVLCFAVSVGVTQWNRDLLYLQMTMALLGGDMPNDPEILLRMVDLNKMDTAQYMLEWTAIYCVKFSYLFFFQNLVKRIRIMEIWWRIVLVIMTAAAIPTICLSLWVCPHYDMSFMGKSVLRIYSYLSC